MRRIIVTCAAAAALTYVLLSTTGTGQAEAQSKKAAKAAKAAPEPTYGNADAITENELKVYDYFLASDQLEGRYFPSRGYDTAALYVASHLAEWGLKPGGSTTGTNGPLQPYMMPIAMVAREIVPEDSKATLVAPAAAAGGRGCGVRCGGDRYGFGADEYGGLPTAERWGCGGVLRGIEGERRACGWARAADGAVCDALRCGAGGLRTGGGSGG